MYWTRLGGTREGKWNGMGWVHIYEMAKKGSWACVLYLLWLSCSFSFSTATVSHLSVNARPRTQFFLNLFFTCC